VDAEAWPTLVEQVRGVLEACPDFTAAMASAAAILKDGVPKISWVGFYLPRADGSLGVGPYQGPLACTVLPAGKGVCGAAATRRETVLVPDVHAFPGHIACDPRSRSEIVVPVLRGRDLRAVLDVDSTRPAAFGEPDQEALEAIAAMLGTF
jgi:GAF domain-containing protein